MSHAAATVDNGSVAAHSCVRAASVMDEQNNSPLFLAPSEVRSRIYEYYLAFTYQDFADTIRPTHTYLEATTPHSTALPSLMLTCRRAYADLREDVHSSAALRVYLPGLRRERRVGFAVHGTLRLERLRRLFLVIDMDHPYWNSWLEFLGALAARTPGLEHLTIDWGPCLVVPISGWDRRLAEKKDDEFLQVLCSMATLQTVWMYGQVPRHWKQRIEQDTKATVRSFPYRWWKEPGLH